MSDLKNEQFSLQWNNFHTNLSSGFHAFLQGQNLVDVTLAAGGKFIQAHKLVLSVCSSYFRDLFEVNPCKHPIVIMKEVGHKELEAILEFMYRGETNVCQDDLSEFLKTAEMLQVKGLADNESSDDQSSPGPSKTTTTTNNKTNTSRAMQNISEKSPLQAPKRERTVNTAPQEVSSQSFKRVKHEPSVSESTSTRPSVSQTSIPAQSPPHTKHILNDPAMATEPESSKAMEHVELAQPKMELVEIEDSDVEEVDNGDDFSFFGGESSQSFQDTSGAASLPDFDNLSQYANMLQEEGQGAVRFLRSKRGKLLLAHNNYIYSYHESNGCKKYWQCRDHSKKRCRGRIMTEGNSLVIRNSEHTHEPHTEEIRERLIWSGVFEESERNSFNFLM